VESCEACYELCRSRTKTVFGVGNPESKIVFLGEGPGANEDRQGEPFVAEAGKLLDKILTASTLGRDQVYILNTVKCRPPNNRNPLPLELENCRGFLDRQLDVMRPEFIVCLGSVAAKSLLGTKSSLGKLRKQFHQYRESKVLVTYHPAYLLRTPSAKTHVWEDMKMLMKELGVELK
jgi:DNA polymerase